MADARLAWLPATELAAMIRNKTMSPVEVVAPYARPWAQHRPGLE
jgi:Asp-tRNA(Asn)/Glu-tRNA(Gln) amidotransferase A subunit family amidase